MAGIELYLSWESILPQISADGRRQEKIFLFRRLGGTKGIIAPGLKKYSSRGEKSILKFLKNFHS
jgi:hypothetical protein